MNKDGVESHTNLETTTDDTTDAAIDTNSDGPEETQFDDILLDDYSEHEDVDESSEDEDQDDEVVEATVVGAAADRMDVDEETITPKPNRKVHELVLLF